jgi:hypothetical protein
MDKPSAAKPLRCSRTLDFPIGVSVTVLPELTSMRAASLKPFSFRSDPCPSEKSVVQYGVSKPRFTRMNTDKPYFYLSHSAGWVLHPARCWAGLGKLRDLRLEIQDKRTSKSGYLTPAVQQNVEISATGHALADADLVTGFGALVGTPECMSLEQAGFNNLDFVSSFFIILEICKSMTSPSLLST